MRFLTYGTGAIGTYIGGSLVIAGQPVVFVERPEVAGGLREHGLRLKLDGSEQRIDAPLVAGSIEEALVHGPFDAMILAIKSYDTEAALQILAPYRVALPPILSFQNGVDNEGLIAGALGEEAVIAGTVTSAVGRRAPGNIVLERKRGVGVAGGHRLAGALAASLDAAGLNARLYPNAAAMKWSKMLTNLLANAVPAILNMTPGEVFADARLYRLEVLQLREALGVMKALRLRPVDLPGTPVRLLAWAIQGLPPSLSRPLVGRAAGKGRGGKMPSFYIDLHGGKGKSEVAFLNGAVARHGAELGLATPVNQTLTDTLMALTLGRMPLEEFDHRPARLLALFES